MHPRYFGPKLREALQAQINKEVGKPALDDLWFAGSALRDLETCIARTCSEAQRDKRPLHCRWRGLAQAVMAT